MSVISKLSTMAAANSANPAWDLAYAYYDPPATLAWNISSAASNTAFSLAGQGTSPIGIFFKPDGTKMYVTDSAGIEVNEYNLLTPWVVNTAIYSQRLAIGTNPTGIFFKEDGTRMYLADYGADRVYEYTLSTAWDISTASLAASISVSAKETFPIGLFFKPDGTKMYVCGTSSTDVNEYNLSTAWDVSTAVFSQAFDVSSLGGSPQGVFFKPDGTKMYVSENIGDDVNEYDLSTAWDISTAVFSRSFSVANQTNVPRCIYFKSDGSGFFVIGNDSDSVFQYTLGGFSVAAQDTTPRSLFFDPDGTKMYIIGGAGLDVNEYSLSTAWDISTTSYVRVFSVGTQDNAPRGIFFKPDGTKMYVVGATGQDVNEYSLSAAWNISTASYVRVFSVSAQDTSPRGIFFKPDGTKMYIAGAAGQDVNEYSLSTAWDISAASYAQNFSISAQETSPYDIFFKDDGTKMYVVGTSGDDVNEYSLSTAWDISTASYVQNFAVAAQDANPVGLFFKDDGTKMYVIGYSTDAVYQYTLGEQP